MWKFFVGLALLWLVLMPPFFTDGACTAELQAESDRVNVDANHWTTSKDAINYWRQRAVPVSVVTLERCLRVKPRFLSQCGDGPLVLASVPVRDRICSIYRDDEIQVRLQFDGGERLAGITTVMAPYRTLPIPFTGRLVHWGR